MTLPAMVRLVSGAIRNHKPEIMFKAFEIAGYDESEVRKRFGGMVNAFNTGTPTADAAGLTVS